MTRSQEAKQPDQVEQTRQTLQTALGKLLLLKAGIAKGEGDKPIEIKLDAETQLVIVSVLYDIGSVIKTLNEQSQSQAKAKPKKKP